MTAQGHMTGGDGDQSTAPRSSRVKLFRKLKISITNANVNNTSSMNELLDTACEFVITAEHVIEVPPYLEDPLAPEAEQDTRGQRRRSSAIREDVGPSTSRVRRSHSSATQRNTQYDASQQYGVPMSAPCTQPANDASTSVGYQYETPQFGDYRHHTEDDMFMQGGPPFTDLLNTPSIGYNAYAQYTSQRPNFNSSPIPFAGTSENREPSTRWQSSQQNQNERRPRRSNHQIHPPDCGTGGRRGYLH